MLFARSTMKVSILITHYHGLAMLRDCLESLRPVAKAGAEVVLVDNGSLDDLSELWRDFGFMRRFKLSKNQQYVGGNNFGLRTCTGDYVLLLNNDTICNASFVWTLAAYLDVNTRVGIVQGKMLLPPYDRLDVCGSFLTAFGFPYHYGYFKSDTVKYGLRKHYAYPVFSAKGACMMLRKDLIATVGGFLFDEDFVCSYEESDLCHRTWLAGWEVHFVPTQPILHLMGATAQSKSNERYMLGHYLRNMMFSLLSNLSWWSLCRIMPGFIALLSLSTLLCGLTFKRQKFLAHMDAWIYNLVNVRKIMTRRKLVRSIRKVSDAHIFDKVLRTPRLSYFVATFRGRIASYEDDK
jgi:GT2 family glycosyltransferase